MHILLYSASAVAFGSGAVFMLAGNDYVHLTSRAVAFANFMLSGHVPFGLLGLMTGIVLAGLASLYQSARRQEALLAQFLDFRDERSYAPSSVKSGLLNSDRFSAQ